MHTFPKEAKRKQKWSTFARIHRLACQRNAFPCAPSILKHRVSAEVCFIGTPVDLKRFYPKKGSLPPIYAKPKDSLDIDYPRNEGKLANRFFPEKHSLDVSLGPPPSLPRNAFVSKIRPPPQKKSISFRIG